VFCGRWPEPHAALALFRQAEKSEAGRDAGELGLAIVLVLVLDIDNSPKTENEDEDEDEIWQPFPLSDLPRSAWLASRRSAG
jgi:hypothetical protein